MTTVLEPPPVRDRKSLVVPGSIRSTGDGVLRGQIDISARVISVFERLGWASEVRRTNPERLARIAARR